MMASSNWFKIAVFKNSSLLNLAKSYDQIAI